ncbi:MAG: guanylate kinase [Pseudomonadota bacterium]|nr:guanylate kinase [Pseudomonadota bacterium]
MPNGYYDIERRGLMLVLSSPSGAGKTTIARLLLERESNVSLSVSVTTRPKRPREVDGEDYFFVDLTEFNLMLNRREFLEHAKVFDHYYGTPRKPIEDALSVGQDILFDIVWQGEQQLKQSARDDLASVFILPPSTEELGRRLKRRAQDPSHVLVARMEKAPDEISHWPEYDYIIINNHIDETVSQVQSILVAERLKRERQTGLTEFAKRLREGR